MSTTKSLIACAALALCLGTVALAHPGADGTRAGAGSVAASPDRGAGPATRDAAGIVTPAQLPPLLAQSSQARPDAPPAPERLTGMAAINALIGNTLVVIEKGRQEFMYFNPDGTATATDRNLVDKAKWRVDGGKLCVDHCFDVVVIGDTATLAGPQGRGSFRGQIVKGNPRNF